MLQTARYPASLHSPALPPNLAARDDRERLSPAALKTFFTIASLWQVRDEDARALLGGVSNGPYYKWKQTPPKLLDTDVLTRISYLVGIFKALNILYGQPLADTWVRLPNTNPIFAGHPPLSHMIRGGIPAMETVRRLLDARRGGN